MIAKVRLPDGRIGRFEVPEGTTAQEVLAFVETQMKLPDQAPPDVAAPPPGVQEGPDEAAINALLAGTPPAGAQGPGTEAPFNVAALNPQQAIQTGTDDLSKPPQAVSDAYRTLENIGQVYPVLETGAQLVTGAAAQPIAGLTALGTIATGGGLDKAAERQKGVQEALTYQPQTARGQEFSTATAYPFTKLQEGAAAVADPIEEAGFPNVAATVASIPEAALLATGAKALKPTNLAKVAQQTKKTVINTMNQVAKPALKKKKTTAATKSYDNKALTAVETIVKDKDQISFLDDSGSPVSRLPESLDDFQSAISQAEKNVFTEYDALSKQTDTFTQVRPVKYPLKPGEKVVFDADGKATGIGTKEPFQVSGKSAVKELDTILDNQALRVEAPGVIKYAQKKIDKYANEKFTAASAQETIQILNQSLNAFYDNPSKANYGKSLVDALVANKMRKDLNTTINKATGKDYQALKKKYQALKTIEDDVAKAANKERNKLTGKLLPEFTDIVAGHQIVSGLAAFNPATVAGGISIELLSAFRKKMKDPNRRIKKMFKTVDDNLAKGVQLGDK